MLSDLVWENITTCMPIHKFALTSSKIYRKVKVHLQAGDYPSNALLIIIYRPFQSIATPVPECKVKNLSKASKL